VSIQAFKAYCRSLYEEARTKGIEEARDFILSMERARPAGHSIRDLLANGAELAADLQRVKSIIDDEAQAQALAEVVQPYLQLVEPNARCQFTGLRLNDIWRYCRLTWSIPRYNTPGRSLFYLIRDRARPNHPIMGVLSLENAPIFIGARDTYVGWSVESFVASLEVLAGRADATDNIRDEFQFLVQSVIQASTLIAADDLCTVEERLHPTEHLVQRLLATALQAASERAAALRRWRDDEVEAEDERDRQMSVYGSVSQRAQDELFRKKRARELARLLSAQLFLQASLASPTWADEWRLFAASEQGRSALRTALLAVKSQHVGTSILELNICGAMPPYNHLLGGKLAALLALSPQIVSDYRARYGRAISQIATQLRGQDVIRPAELVYIGTTSLYKVGASQYNRLRLPAGLFGDALPAIAFTMIGETSGFGTLHISDDTTKALQDAVDTEYMEVNHVMGEGVSPKFRILRRGLDKILAPNQRNLSDEIMRHGVSRLVYGMPIALNAQAYLQGRTEAPEYPWSAAMPPDEGTQRIVDFWRRRWLRQRLAFAPALERVGAWTPDAILLSRLLAPETVEPAAPAEPSVLSLFADAHGDHERRLVRDLYRGTTGFADDVSEHDLRLLHATTRLDDLVLAHLRAGQSVVLTGNPGDGKTHLLRILTDDMGAHVMVEPDASAVSNAEVFARWQEAVDRNIPYALAVNEAVLFNLAASYPTFKPFQDARTQVLKAIGYGMAEQVDTSAVVVFDLSRRNPLAPGVVGAIMDRLTSDTLVPRCNVCPQAGCDFARHRELLRQPLVRHRLQEIFDRITRRGQHVTMRDVQAFVSYLLFANRACDGLIQTSNQAFNALPQLVYNGTGTLFKEASRTFDPARIAHPRIDDALVTGSSQIDAAGWLVGSGVANVSLDPGEKTLFHQRKRAFYFFHRNGDALLPMASDDERLFADFLALAEREALRDILRKLNYFFGQGNDAERLQVWQYHRYDQSAHHVLYALDSRARGELEIVKPVLVDHMAAAYDLAADHVLLRLKSTSQASRRAHLRIDYHLFQVLLQAERGLPMLLLQPPIARRIWQFLEQAAPTQKRSDEDTEKRVDVIDPTLNERLTVTFDIQDGAEQYISVTEGRSHAV